MMGDTENGKTGTPLAKRVWLYFFPILALVIVYVGWVMLNRWQENKQAEERVAAEAKEKERADAQGTVEVLGGKKFDIIAFYASPTAIRRGESTQLCYGVSNAKEVSLDPPVAEMWPSVSRCLEVTPKNSTTYTLRAADAQGNTTSASVEVKVR